MPTLFKHRQYRFEALHALLTGMRRPTRTPVPPVLRRDVGLPETFDPRGPSLFDPTLGAARHRD